MRIIRKKGMRRQDTTHRSVAIFGGAFSPPHRGHVAMVRALLKDPSIDQVWILPVYRHPFAKEMVLFRHRLAMSRLAFASLSPRVRVRPLEQRLKGTSYTIRILRHLHRLYPRTRFRLVMGADSYKERNKWKDMEGIRRMVDLIVFARGSSSEVPAISSTGLRRILKQGHAIKRWVPPKVARYIQEKNLYT